MPSQVTVTAKTGPDRQVTDLVLTGVTKVSYDYEKKVCQIDLVGPMGPARKEFDLAGVTVITDTITGANHVLVLS